VKNWPKFQHYKDRNPPWLKLHKSFLDDYEFHRLPAASRAIAPCVWLLASESTDGSVAHDSEMIAFRLRMSVKDVEAAIQPLVSAGFLIMMQDASKTLADKEQDASKTLALARSREERREEGEKDSRASHSLLNGAFTEFWDAYPKKRSKGDAEKAWLKLKPDASLQSRILVSLTAASVSKDWQREGGKFIPHPATWLNAKGWEDSYEQAASKSVLPI
jgi:hypothetical protein